MRKNSKRKKKGRAGVQTDMKRARRAKRETDRGGDADCDKSRHVQGPQWLQSPT